MKRYLPILLPFLLLSCILYTGCGSGGGNLTLNTPITSGQVTITVKDVKTAKTLEAVDPMKSEFDESGDEIVKKESIKPKNSTFLLVIYDLKNTADKNILVLEPQVRSESGEYYESESANLKVKYEVGLKDIGSFMGGDLKPKELRIGITSIYDVPDGVLEFGVAKTNYEGSSLEEILKEGFKKGKPDIAWYKMTSLSSPVEALDIGKD